MSETPFRIVPNAKPGVHDYWAQDPVLQDLLARKLSPAALAWLTPELRKLGPAAAQDAAALAFTADKYSPVLRQYDRWGERVDEVDYHPSYREMEKIGYGCGSIAVKYDPELRAKFEGELQVAGFALAFLFAEAECGLSCPICMTDGVARVLEQVGSAEQQAKWIPRLASRDTKTLLSGAMFLTEKQGGSDVGKNATRAVKQPDGTWKLYGEKWFCSNVDAGLKLVLARPDGAPEGTRGLGLFLVPHHKADGTRNEIRIDRLKDKLGVRSMPSGECILEGCEAELVGELDQGFKQMAEMLNLSRLWNSVCSVSIMRRAISEATAYLRERVTFGKRAIEHGLVREMLADLNAEEIAHKYLVFELCNLLDQGDKGSRDAAQLTRILTPLSKYGTAKASVWAASECIELVGGNGYIEDSHLPRLLRDAQVLPVWEGTTNILVLDALRVVSKTGAHEVLAADIRRRAGKAPASLAAEAKAAEQLLNRAMLDLAVIAQEGPERAADVLKRFTDRLLAAYEIALLLDACATETAMTPVLAAAARRMVRRHANPELRMSADDVTALVERTFA